MKNMFTDILSTCRFANSYRIFLYMESMYKTISLVKIWHTVIVKMKIWYAMIR